MGFINLNRICVNVNTEFKLKEFQGFVKENIRLLVGYKETNESSKRPCHTE
jgi:hypothetical protein